MKKKSKKRSLQKSKSNPAQGRRTKSQKLPKGQTLEKHNHFMQVLTKKREEILNTVKQKEADFALGEIGDELDFANQTFEREMMFEMTNGERVVLDDIEAALRKIEKDDFGFCESCRKKISSARLHAMPWARNCIDCQTVTEIQTKTP